ncbi:hypothetical protein LCGC14_1224010 [marine sediment metagenome]|uniref:Uncharacterized protein n=1 Tax=marine sediment metagenome TaxID=412755 RepID=A0A0F9LEH8_9ZZZZ
MTIYKWVCTYCYEVSTTNIGGKHICGKCRHSDRMQLLDANKAKTLEGLL